MKIHKKAVGVTVLVVAGIWEIAEKTEFMRQLIPPRLAKIMNSEPILVLVLICLSLFLLFTHEGKEDRDEKPESSGATASASASGNDLSTSSQSKVAESIAPIVDASRHEHTHHHYGDSEQEEVQISITCDVVPLPMYYKGDLWVLGCASPFVGMMKLSFGGMEHPWPEEGVYGTGYKLTVKNYGTRTAYGISIPFGVEVWEWIQLGPASWGDGPAKGERTVEAIIPVPLGQQGKDEFSFYICSYDPESSFSVHVPQQGSINSEDPMSRREVPIRLTPARSLISVPAKLMRDRS